MHTVKYCTPPVPLGGRGWKCARNVSRNIRKYYILSPTHNHLQKNRNIHIEKHSHVYADTQNNTHRKPTLETTTHIHNCTQNRLDLKE